MNRGWRLPEGSTVLVIGSGPIVIGQACEFDYSGTQACKALRALGYRVVLMNSNPATIMTDEELADATYVEPLTLESARQVQSVQQHVSRFDLAVAWIKLAGLVALPGVIEARVIEHGASLGCTVRTEGFSERSAAAFGRKGPPLRSHQRRAPKRWF